MSTYFELLCVETGEYIHLGKVWKLGFNPVSFEAIGQFVHQSWQRGHTFVLVQDSQVDAKDWLAEKGITAIDVTSHFESE